MPLSPSDIIQGPKKGLKLLSSNSKTLFYNTKIKFIGCSPHDLKFINLHGILEYLKLKVFMLQTMY